MAHSLSQRVVLQLLLIGISSYCLSFSTAVTVHVDADKGSDIDNCVAATTEAIPCKTLQFAVNATKSYQSTTFILLSDLLLQDVINFTSRHNVAVTAYNKEQNSTGQINRLRCNCKQSNSCGLLFENCENVTLEKITVSSCSVKQQIGFHKKELVIRGGIIIKNGTGTITLRQLAAIYNRGYGMVLLNTGNRVGIFQSNFTNNALLDMSSTDRGGGGLYIKLFCGYGMSNSSCSRLEYDIVESNFIGNSIRWNKMDLGFWSASYGGGLSMFIGLGATENNISIQNCSFEQNKAVFGGGLSITCEEGCEHNEFKIKNSIFKQNFLLEGYGGGAGMAIGLTSYKKQQPYNNTILVSNCTFVSNSGVYGAGTLVHASRQVYICNKLENNKVYFINCTWSNNHGVVSSAVDLAPDFRFQDDTRFIVTVTFTDCIFQDNHLLTYKVKNIPDEKLEILGRYYPHTHFIPIQQYRHNGVFLVTKLQVFFRGTNLFLNNTGTALYLCSSLANFREHSNTYFINNTGLFGGAVSLYGFSRINYRNNIAIYFRGNKARLGGAMFVYSIDQHLSFASYTCFLSHSSGGKQPLLQNVTFTFSANWAEYDISHSLYLSSSVQPCVRACGFISNMSSQQIFANGSCLGNFTYDSENQIAADGIMAIQKIRNNQSHLTITPGLTYSLPIDIFDTFGNNVTNTSIYTAHIDNEKTGCENASIDPSFTISPVSFIRILGQPTTVKCLLILTIVGSLGTQIEVNFTLSWCQPGYVIEDTVEPNLGSCVCSASLDKQYHYYGISRCNSSTHSAIIDPGLWVGYDNITMPTQENLYTAPCPTGYCRNDVTELNVTATSLSEHICVENRGGFLCGKCQKSMSVYFNDYYSMCSNNHKCRFGPLFYIALELLPISVIFIVIILADVRLTSGMAYSTLFVAQMLYSVSFTVNGVYHLFPGFTSLDYIYGVVHLNFHFYSFCLWTGSTALDVLVMKYVSMVYAIGLVVCTILLFNCFQCGRLNRCLRYRDRKYSIVQGLSTFLVICYSQSAYVTFNILGASTATNIGSKHVKHVVYLAGHISYFDNKHLPYAVPAIIVGVTIVIPFPLILFFDSSLLKIEGFFVKHGMLKSHLPWTLFRMKLKPFLDAFQGCFRDNARYFAGLFFIYRAAIHAVTTFVQIKSHLFIYLEVMLILMLTIQAVIQPFEKRWHNILSSCMFFIFLSINSLAIANYLLFFSGAEEVEMLVMQWLQLILGFAPMLVGMAACGIWLAKIIRNARPSIGTEYRFTWRRHSNRYGSVSLVDQVARSSDPY